MVMYRIFPQICLFIAASASMFAQEAITIDRVNFKSLRDNWVQMKVELSCGGNPSPDARNTRFVEEIKVKAYLAYKVGDGFDFYFSEVEIIIMEQGDDNSVYFYLPGQIVERDKLSSTDPDFYFVELSVGGEAQPSQKTARSSSIKNEAILASMKAKAESEGTKNEHILMPVYYVPAEYLGSVDKLPTFLRRDVRQ
jgi:hypothetical protein